MVVPALTLATTPEPRLIVATEVLLLVHEPPVELHASVVPVPRQALAVPVMFNVRC